MEFVVMAIIYNIESFVKLNRVERQICGIILSIGQTHLSFS